MTRFEDEMRYLISKYVPESEFNEATREFSDIMKTTFKYCIAQTEHSNQMKVELHNTDYSLQEYHVAIHKLAEAILDNPEMLDIKYENDYWCERKIYTLNIIK